MCPLHHHDPHNKGIVQCLTGLISCQILTTDTPGCLPLRAMYALSFSLKSVLVPLLPALLCMQYHVVIEHAITGLAFIWKYCHDNMKVLSWVLHLSMPWWRHQMETFSAFLAFRAGNSPVTGEFPAQRPVMRSFGVFFDLRLNKRLSKPSWGWWFETPSSPLWRHCNAYFTHHYTKQSMAKKHLHCKVFIHLIQTCTFAIQPTGSLHFMAKAHIVPPRLWRADQWLVSLFKQGHGLLRISHVKIHVS